MHPGALSQCAHGIFSVWCICRASTIPVFFLDQNLECHWIYFCISMKITWKTGPYVYLPPDAHRLPLRSFLFPKVTLKLSAKGKKWVGSRPAAVILFHAYLMQSNNSLIHLMDILGLHGSVHSLVRYSNCISTRSGTLQLSDNNPLSVPYLLQEQVLYGFCTLYT